MESHPLAHSQTESLLLGVLIGAGLLFLLTQALKQENPDLPTPVVIPPQPVAPSIYGRRCK